MAASVSEQCRVCIMILKTIISTLSDPNSQKGRVRPEQISDELERLSLWIGNIGALQRPDSSMSLESRLCEDSDVLTHVVQLLDDLNEVSGELSDIVSGRREGGMASVPHDDGEEENQDEETELLGEIAACITRLFRISSLIRQAAPSDTFAKSLTRNRYRFNDQFDIAHVGEKYPKLATAEFSWLRKRLGRAITQRRHYLSYIQDHRGKLEDIPIHGEIPGPVAPESQVHTKQLSATKPLPDSSSQPSIFTKASTLTPGRITPQMLAAEEELDPENDARSYTTISRSIDDNIDSSVTARFPKLDDLRTGSKKEFECPFCFRIKKFKNEKVWRKHVFSDLRTYVCTFPDCDTLLFGDINEWFRHEMHNHRVSYICRLCENKHFQFSERYLAHVRRQHPDMLEDYDETPILDTARRSLDQIPAQECPCCSEWVGRLREQAPLASMPSDASDHVLNVVPTVFKRHLASHLEQLASFAVPIGSATGIDASSNVAIEEDVGALWGSSDLSSLAFDSPRPSSPEGVVKAAAGKDEYETEKEASPVNEKEAEIPITEGMVDVVATENIKETIETLRQAVNVTPKDNRNLVDLLNKLGSVLRSRHEHTGNAEDLKEATVLMRQAVTILHEARADIRGIIEQMTILANILTYRYERTGDTKDLEEAIQIARQAVNLTPDDHPDRPILLQNLGTNLGRRYELTEYIRDLEETIKIMRQAADLTTDNRAYRLVALQNLAMSLGRQYEHTGNTKDLEEAIQIARQAVNLTPDDHPDRPILLQNLGTNLGRLYAYTGNMKDLEEAIQIARQAVELTPSDLPVLAYRLNNLGSLLNIQGHYEEAVVIYRRALNDGQKILGSDHPEILATMSNLALTFQNQGRWKEAEELELQVLETRKVKLSVDHLDTLSSMSNLALIFQNQGRWKEAEELELQVMEIRKEKLGVDHPDTLSSMSNLALTFQNQGRWKEAEELEVQVMETRKVKLGIDHPYTVSSMANLALTFQNQGRWKEAEELEVQVMETRKVKLGIDHPYTVSSMANLALTFQNQGRWKEAEELHRQVMETRKEILTIDHPDTLSSMANLALSLKCQGQWKEAEELDRQIMEIRKEKLGAAHPDTLSSMSNLASTFQNQGRWKEAEELEVQIMETRKQVLGSAHPDTLSSMTILASTFKNQGRWKEAEELEVQVMETSKEVFGPAHPNTLSIMANLAFTLRALTHKKEAISLMETCLQMRKQALGPDHPDMKSLVETLNEWQKETIEEVH